MGTRRALVVANDEYRDPGLQSLRSPATDAAALAEVLGDPDIGQFDLNVVRNANVQELREQLDRFFGTASRDDELLVHFSCHGLKDDANDLYLAASDTRPGLLASTGLPADFIARRMRASRARSVALLLDCCYGGAFERGMLARAAGEVSVLDSFGPGQLAEGSGRVVITASSAVEYAFEGNHLADSGETSPSVFTSAIVEGIGTGEADTGGTGRIGVHELFAYAEEHVRRTNPRQTPHLWSFGTRGDILVARTPLRRVVPAALPVAVQTALAGDRISRLGAVHELSQLLGREDPTVVLAAVQALGFLVDDDSRSLSEAASSALGRVTLTASPAVLEVPVGEQVEVELDGSALAVAARVTAAPDWAHVRQIGSRLLITGSPDGTSTGTVAVEGPTGSVEIALTVTVPEPEPVVEPEPEPVVVPEPTSRPELDPVVASGPTPQVVPDAAAGAESAPRAEFEAAATPEAITAPGTEPTSAAGRRTEAEPAPVGLLSTFAAADAPASPREVSDRPSASTATRVCWGIAGGLLLLGFGLPMDGDGLDQIISDDSAGDFQPPLTAVWAVVVLLAGGLLIAGAARWRARGSVTALGIVASVLAAGAGVLAIAAAMSDEPAAGTFAALTAVALAIAGTVIAAWPRRTEPTPQ
ncbi:caspase, EACC1-associated type [Kribbella endophytica]